MVGVIGVGDRGAHDLAAIEVEDQVEKKPASRDLGRQIRHVPTPDLAGAGGHMGGRGTRRPGVFARPRWCVWPADRKIRLKVDSLARYTPSSASVGTIRAGGMAAKRGSLVTLRILARSASDRAWAGVLCAASGRRSPCVRPEPRSQRCRVRISMPASAQTACRRAPSACACRIFWARVWRSFSGIIRPRPPERSPRVFLRAPARPRSPPRPCLCAASRARAPGCAVDPCGGLLGSCPGLRRGGQCRDGLIPPGFQIQRIQALFPTPDAFSRLI